MSEDRAQSQAAAATAQQTRANSLSLPWTRGQETVPAYEEALGDRHAITYRVAESRTAGSPTYLLHSDHRQTQLQASPAPTQKKNASAAKESEGPFLVTRYGTHDSPAKECATISSVNRKKLNLKSKDPTVSIAFASSSSSSPASDEPVDMVLYRGGYCGFKRGDVEYFWQVRYHSKTMFDDSHPAFKDAVLRKNKEGEASSIAAWYVPHAPSASSTSAAAAAGKEEGEEHDKGEKKELGLLVLPDSQAAVETGDEVDLVVMSFIALLVRVIDAKEHVGHITGFFSALTIGQS